MGRPAAILVALLAALMLALPNAATAGGGKGGHGAKGGSGAKHGNGGKGGARGKARLQAKIGWGPISDAKAAKRVERTGWEPRPGNYVPNHTVATREQLRYFHANSDMPYQRWVDGQYTGTTDDIIEWAANKWGLPEDVLRAVAVHETWWEMGFLGDDGDSFGIFQVRQPYHCCFPFTHDSTAFNADYYGGIIRAYYDGEMDWLNNPNVRPDNGKTYRAGNLWESVGAWVGGRWHTPQTAEYIANVKRHLRERTWATHPWFPTHP